MRGFSKAIIELNPVKRTDHFRQSPLMRLYFWLGFISLSVIGGFSSPFASNASLTFRLLYSAWRTPYELLSLSASPARLTKRSRQNMLRVSLSILAGVFHPWMIVQMPVRRWIHFPKTETFRIRVLNDLLADVFVVKCVLHIIWQAKVVSGVLVSALITMSCCLDFSSSLKPMKVLSLRFVLLIMALWFITVSNP